MSYYGGLSEGVKQLSEELVADLHHFSRTTYHAGIMRIALPENVQEAMRYLASEFKRLSDLAETIDGYMQENADYYDVANSYRNARQTISVP